MKQLIERVFGSQAELGRRLGVGRNTVHNWIYRDRVPVERVVQIVRLARGRIKHHELRPDVWPPQEARRSAR